MTDDKTDAQGPSRTELLDRARRVQAALVDMPPHSGSGTRERLQAELSRLERQLAEG